MSFDVRGVFLLKTPFYPDTACRPGLQPASVPVVFHVMTSVATKAIECDDQLGLAFRTAYLSGNLLVAIQHPACCYLFVSRRRRTNDYGMMDIVSLSDSLPRTSVLLFILVHCVLIRSDMRERYLSSTVECLIRAMRMTVEADE